MKKLFMIVFCSILFSASYGQAARVQLIHNSPDPILDAVDIYFNSHLVLDDFEFRTATPFMDAPTDVLIEVGIAMSSSSAADDAFMTFEYTLNAGHTYLFVAQGLVSTIGYNPDVPFDIGVFTSAREMSLSSLNTDIIIHHGVTDAPSFDVKEVGLNVGAIASDAIFGDFAGYLELPLNDYIFEVKKAATLEAIATFDAPFATMGLGGKAITIIASGFFNPSLNSNGPGLGLFLALPTGGDLIELSFASLSLFHNDVENGEILIYPNPSSDYLVVKNDQMSYETISIMSFEGKELIHVLIDQSETTVDVSELPTGMYIVKLSGLLGETTRIIQVNSK